MTNPTIVPAPVAVPSPAPAAAPSKPGIWQRYKNHRQEKKDAKNAKERAGIEVDLKVDKTRLTEFINDMIQTLRTGQSVEETTSSDSMMRELLTSERFISDITDVAIKTPMEELDRKYAKQMIKHRKDLAEQLQQARENKEYLMPVPNAHQMDIMITTMVGHAPMYDRARLEAEAVKTGKDNVKWPDDKPTPPEVFCAFLEDVAIKRHPGNEGEYVGNVWKGLCASRTLTKETRMTLRKIIDPSFANQHLYNRAVVPIESAVKLFSNPVSEIIVLPTSQLHPTLGVPGMGYDRIYPVQLAIKQAAIPQAHADYNSSKATRDDAKAVYDETVRLRKMVEKKRWKVTKADLKLVREKETEAENNFKAADKKHEDFKKKYFRLAEDLNDFERNRNPAAMHKMLVENFRSQLLEGKNAEEDLRKIGAQMGPRMRNQLVDRLVVRAQEMVKERDEFVPMMMGSIAVAVPSEGLDLSKIAGSLPYQAYEAERTRAQERTKKSESVALTLVGHKETGFKEKLRIFVDDVDQAELPQVVKSELLGVAKSLEGRDAPRDVLDSRLKEIREAYAEPLRSAAELAVGDLNKVTDYNLAGITPAQWIIARQTFVAASPEIESPQADAEGKWQKFKDGLSYHLFTPRAYADKAKKIWRVTIADDVVAIAGKDRFKRSFGKDPEGRPYKTLFPNIVRGAFMLTLKVYMATALYVGWTQSPSLFTHFIYDNQAVERKVENKWNLWEVWSKYHEDIRLIHPLKWVSEPVKRITVVKRVVHDSYDDWTQLSSRDDAYYKMDARNGNGEWLGFGLGKMLEGEKDDTGVKARLTAARAHPDWLKYMQERRNGREVIEYTRVGQTPDSCTSAPKPIPDTCSGGQKPKSEEKTDDMIVSGFGIRSMDDAVNYEPHDDDGWKKGWPICCTVDIKYRYFDDGYRLNTAMSDKFVQYLMSLEAKGVKVDYKYLTDLDNRTIWADRWFLISATEDDIRNTYSLHSKDKVSFIMAQVGDSESSKMFVKVCHRAEAKDFIPEERRDEFVGLWIDAIRAKDGKLDPTVDTVSADILNDGFNVALNQAKGKRMVLDVTREYERNTMLKDLDSLRLQTATAKDTLIAQSDIRELVKMFVNPTAKYRINPVLSDAFVKTLAEYKRSGKDINDYNPFMEVPGVKVQLAVKQTYLIPNAEFKSTDNSRYVGGVLPTLTDDQRRWWTEPKNEFRDYVDAVITELSTKADGKQFSDVLAKRFKGNTDAMKDTIKAELYTYLTSTNPLEISSRNDKSSGMKVSDPSQPLSVTIVDQKTLRNHLRGHIKTYISELQRTATSPPQ